MKMSPLNRGPLMGPRVPSAMRPHMPRYGRVPLPPPPIGMTRGMPPPPSSPMFGPRGRPMPLPLRPGPMMGRPGVPPGSAMFGPRGRNLPPMPPMGLTGPMGPRGPMMRPVPGRGIPPPHALYMRPRFPVNNSNGKGKMNNNKKNKLEELELKKPWMTDEIRSEIQKKNKLYAKAKKNKDAKEWEEFKDLRNKVTRMIRDAKNEFLAKNPEQAHLCENDEVVEEDFDNVDELSSNSEESNTCYCEVCDRDFDSEELYKKHTAEHQTCNIEGCKFTAHPKIVEKHISMQHYTGLYQRMKVLMTDGDIDNWKAERRRRYPTAINIKLQEAEKLEKEKRGEVIRANVKNNQLLKRENSRKIHKRKRNKVFQPKLKTEKLEQIVYRGLMPFAGLATLDETDFNDSQLEENVIEKIVEECKFEFSDEDDQVVKQSTATKSPYLNSAVPQMLSLVADYGSDSNNDEPPDEIPSKISKLNNDEGLCLEQVQLEVKNVVDNVKTSVCTSVDSKFTVKEDKQQNTAKRKLNMAQRHNNSKYSKNRLILLNKLLTRSIQYERNTIYQCITFIANNNFFE